MALAIIIVFIKIPLIPAFLITFLILVLSYSEYRKLKNDALTK